MKENMALRERFELSLSQTKDERIFIVRRPNPNWVCNMAVTEVSLALSLGMIGMISSVVVGTWGGKEQETLFPSLIIFGAVIPIILAIVYGNLSSFITLMDWPSSSYALIPHITAFIGSWVGGFFGLKAGHYWESDGDRSCFQCLLVPTGLLLIGSVIVLFLP